MAAQVQWRFSGDYFENCNCSVVCPCLISKAAPLTSRPTEGACDVAAIFHIERGSYGDVTLDGLNVAVAIHTPGPMGEGNWSVGAYIDERADDKQTEALGAIFTGAAGGPMAAFAPLISKNLGAKKVPIAYRIDGKKRSAEIPGILHMAVDPLPTMHPSGEMWANTGHPISPEKLALAVARSPITECVGIIPERTGITRRSAGPTNDRGTERPYLIFFYCLLPQPMGLCCQARLATYRVKEKVSRKCAANDSTKPAA